MCRFLSNNKVYPSDVVVIESGINDILVRRSTFQVHACQVVRMLDCKLNMG